MAALRAGIHTVIIPRENEKDLEEIDQSVRAAMNFISTDHVDKILDTVLLRGVPEEETAGAFLPPKEGEPASRRIRQ